MDAKTKLKAIERQEAKLARERKKILEQEKQMKAEDAKLDSLVKQSGYKNAKLLVKALVEKYKITLPRSSKGAGRGRGKAIAVTPELRDLVKKGIKEGRSKNSLAKELKLNYPKITAICAGKFDKLK